QRSSSAANRFWAYQIAHQPRWRRTKSRWRQSDWEKILSFRVSVRPREPAGQPASFTAFRRRISNPPAKHSLGRSREFVECGLRAVHIFQDLEQAPSFAVIAFACQRAFTLKIYVVNQRVTALSARSDAVELPLHVFAISCLGHHFGQGVLQALDQKLGLEIDRIDEELAQLFHF